MQKAHGCQSHPAAAPTGSNRSSHGGNEVAEAFDQRVTNWRFSRLLLPGFRRRSTMCIATLAFASAGLLHPHVPFDEAANLTLGIAASHHARDKLAVLLFGIAVLFRAKRDNRKKVFDLREYAFLDDFSNLFITGPGRVFAAVPCPRPQRELDDLVAEVLRVCDARRLLDLGQFLVEKVAIEHLAC